MRIGHISDLHIGKSEEESRATRDLVKRLNMLELDVVVVSGDVIHIPADTSLMHEARDLLDALECPVVAVPGNHDVQSPQPDETFFDLFGSTPGLFEHDDVSILLFDSMAGLPVVDRTPEDHDCYNRLGWWSDGRVDEAQFDALSARLAARTSGRHQVAVVHHHLQPSPNTHVDPLCNADEFVAWCVQHQVSHVFVGHWHYTAFSCDIGGVVRLRVGRSTAYPYPLGVLDLDTGRYQIRTS